MPAPSSRTITITADGGEISGSTPVRFRWSDLGSVTALTRPGELEDRLTLRLRLADGRTVEVDEATGGFTQLVEALPDILPGFPERNEWLYETAGGDPSEETVLYEAGGTGGEARRS
ncbi:MAG TPA: hypothetical protein VMS56_13995 [Thermoanaerobaculia bacterium]|nr:hypothetical protein [Thermoanaerobaculia bacterium]